jgi:hypothetical protein
VTEYGLARDVIKSCTFYLFCMNLFRSGNCIKATESEY